MRFQLLNDFIRTPVLLGGEKAVIEQPVIIFSVFMLSSEQLHRCFHQLQHFMAAFNALCVLLNPGICKVHAGEVDGL